MPDVREWWLTRPHFDQAPEVAGKAAALLTALRNSGRLRIIPPLAYPAVIQTSDTRARPLEARLPALARALELAGQDLLRLSNEVERLVVEHPDRPEPLLAQARLGLGPLRDARLTGAQQYAEADAKAKASVDRAFASWDFDAGVRAYDPGDRSKARELWTKAANNGHAEAAARLKAIENESP